MRRAIRTSKPISVDDAGLDIVTGEMKEDVRKDVKEWFWQTRRAYARKFGLKVGEEDGEEE